MFTRLSAYGVMVVVTLVGFVLTGCDKQAISPLDEVLKNPSPTVTPQASATAVTQTVATIKVTATPALPAARNLTATWKGTGTYYILNFTGKRVAKVTTDIQMTLRQNGDTVTGSVDTVPIKQESLGTDLWVPDIDSSREMRNGVVSSTNLTFDVGSNVVGFTEKWEFTFTSDLMSGEVRNTSNRFIGRDSDPKAFSLTRQK